MEGHEKWDGDWTQCENFVGYIHSSHTVSYSETEEHGFWSLEHKMSNVFFFFVNVSCFWIVYVSMFADGDYADISMKLWIT